MAGKCDERQNYVLSKLLPVPGHLQYIRNSETEILLQWRNCQRFEEPTGLFYCSLAKLSLRPQVSQSPPHI